MKGVHEMETSIHLSSNAVVLLALGAMFLLVLACAHKAITKMALFGNAGGWVVAVCVALLSIIGLVRFFAAPDQPARSGAEPVETSGLLDFVLLPYVVLPIAILLVLLFSMVEKVRHCWRSHRLHDGTENRKTLSKSAASEGDDRRKEASESEPSEATRITSSGYRER